MTHGSLFSGIGGFDLAAEWRGWENVFHCEWNEFGQKVLKYYWPKAISYHDITKTDFSIHRGSIDILTGGFPCQPYSIAGKRKGKDDERHLWPEMLRAIREIQPRFIVGENVPGLVNWDGGMVFEQVQTEMEAQGYKVTPFLLPAASVGAPHTRERIWFIAHASGYGGQEEAKRERGTNEENNEQSECLYNIRATENTSRDGEQEIITDSTSRRQQRRNINGELAESKREALFKRSEQTNDGKGYGIQQTTSDANAAGFSTIMQPEVNDSKERENTGRYVEQYSSNDGRTLQATGWENFPIKSPICDGDDGLSGRLDSITFPQWRIKSIMAGGNAIVPQVALQIFKAIEQYELLSA